MFKNTSVILFFSSISQLSLNRLTLFTTYLELHCLRIIRIALLLKTLLSQGWLHNIRKTLAGRSGLYRYTIRFKVISRHAKTTNKPVTSVPIKALTQKSDALRLLVTFRQETQQFYVTVLTFQRFYQYSTTHLYHTPLPTCRAKCSQGYICTLSRIHASILHLLRSCEINEKTTCISI